MHVRPAALLAAVPLLAVVPLLLAGPAGAATPAPTATITYRPAAANSLLTVAPASMAPTPATEVAGVAFRFANGDAVHGVTLTATSKNWTLHLTLAKGAAALATVPAAGTFTYQAVGTDAGSALGGTSAGSGRAAGTIDATAAPASSPPPSHGASAAPTTPAQAGSSPTGPAAAAGSASSAGLARTRSVGGLPGPVAYPGGVLPSIEPGTTEGVAVLPPRVAPYATSTAPDGGLTTLFSTYPPAPAPGAAAALAPGSAGSGSGRSFGLAAAVTAVVLVGLVATLLRLLLAHPAARAVGRRQH